MVYGLGCRVYRRIVAPGGHWGCSNVCVCVCARARVFCGGKADLVVVLCFGRTQQAFKPFDLYMYICI